ncbi:hypothetical protein PF002_g13113 [Phytophthora fragariae]|uniref:Reverse transcriptase domain-containing protein n=1 Tax=Phytophthora fragariae TaxID=53985 RepID=A0A6A3FBG3_9STRA|nr:hypothetical protein PF003_g27345 [Phytophthora fragariae]KAE8942503.1 hypothetical protein PF009_g7745 [Phytophthora fragariae]KAE9011206.1 hypothetical protein PF011_g9468 [Phytophthora fragariae]KAE9105962.1 hypothetical protein PF007_g13580 [Phytophthora fragariae]KAE9146599.1 hypothetical protein PF006_g8644 [Phytophthora fragariae]
MLYGDKLGDEAPVDSVEVIGGFVLPVLGVWSFEMQSVYGQLVTVKACIIEGCTAELLLGVDFLRGHEATMDFHKNEVRYQDDKAQVVIPFRTFDEAVRTSVATVRTVRRTRIAQGTVVPMQVAVAAEDGERGIFVPTKNTGAVMLATTVAEVKGGRAWVPTINAGGSRANLPPKQQLGTWIPLDHDMEVLDLKGELSRERLTSWLKEIGDTATPLDNEEEVRIGTEDPEGRALVMKLLRAYRQVSVSTSDCPSSTALDIEHHIDTGKEAPIILNRRRQAQTEDAMVEGNVRKMLNAGVIEEGNGAWGFPVVLVKKKDGEVRFCVRLPRAKQDH